MMRSAKEIVARPATFTHEDDEHVGHLYYFKPAHAAPGPYTTQRHVKAIIDIANDGTIAGVDLIDNMPPPPVADYIERTAAPAHVLNEDDAADLQQGRPYQDVLAAKRTAAPADLPLDRDTLGRMVREAWVRWAKTQPNPKSSWLLPYDDLSEPDQEADRQIGEAIAKWTTIHEQARASLTAPAAPAGGSPYRFDRYINGVLMAEGVTIENESTLEAAMVKAARIASRGPNGETPVLVLASTAPPAEAIAATEEMRKTAKELRETSNGNTNAIEQALYWERKAASLLAAPADLVLETTAEERAIWIDAAIPSHPVWRRIGALIRDLDKAIAHAASETKRADEAVHRAETYALDIGIRRQDTYDLHVKLATADRERDREAAARREAEHDRYNTACNRDDWRERAEQAEAEIATLRAAQMPAEPRKNVLDAVIRRSLAGLSYEDAKDIYYVIRAALAEPDAALATNSTGEGD